MLHADTTLLRQDKPGRLHLEARLEIQGLGSSVVLMDMQRQCLGIKTTTELFPQCNNAMSVSHPAMRFVDLEIQAE